MKKIFILVGASGSGKTWVANQITDKFTYVPHDRYGLKSNDEYVKAISAIANASSKPIVCDTPFSLSQIQSPLAKLGYEVKPVFVVEKPSVTRQRYEARYATEKKGQEQMPKGHLSRIQTYIDRAKELKAPIGTSTEILDYMRNHADKESIATQRPEPRLQHEAHDPQRDNERNEIEEGTEIQNASPEAVHDVQHWSV
jgi:hypothetical protein